MLDVADVVDLAAEMEVQKIEAIAHARAAKIFERFDHFGNEEAEFRSHATGLFPATCALGRELYAHADAWFYVVKLGVLDDQFQLAEFFDHGDNVLPDFRREDDPLR